LPPFPRDAAPRLAVGDPSLLRVFYSRHPASRREDMRPEHRKQAVILSLFLHKTIFFSKSVAVALKRNKHMYMMN